MLTFRPGTMRAIFVLVVVLFAALRFATICSVMNITTDGSFDQEVFVSDGHAFAESGHIQDYYYGPGYQVALGVTVRAQQALGLEDLPLRLTAGVMQTLLYAAVLALFGAAIYRRYSRLAGVGTVLLVAVWFNQVLASGVLMSERLSTPMFLLGTTALLWRQRPTKSLLLLSGLSFGAMILARPALAPVAITAGLIAACLGRQDWKRRLGRFCLVALTALSLQGVWIGYVHHMTGYWTSGSTSGGLNYCLGNSPYDSFSWRGKEYKWCLKGAPKEQFAQNNYELRRGWHWASGHLDKQPGRVRLRWRAVFDREQEAIWQYPTYDNYEGPGNRQTLITWFERWWSWMKQLSLLGLAWGLIKSPWRRLYTITLALAASQLVIPLVSVGDMRYHDAIVPLMAFWISGMVADMAQRICDDQRKYRAELAEEADKEGEAVG